MVEGMNRVLLLTSTVYPDIENYDVDQEERKNEYISAINYYLKNTFYKIVIVDNSDYNFADDIIDRRLECLFYKAVKEDAIYGKGYGESKILSYAIENSLFLQNAEQIVKITGRHIIVNIESLLSSCKNADDVYIDVDLNFKYAHSYFFACNKAFLIDYLLPRQEEMNDSKGSHFEHSLAKALMCWKEQGKIHHEFRYPIFIDGHPGNSSIMYKKPTVIRRIKILVKYYLNEIKIIATNYI